MGRDRNGPREGTEATLGADSKTLCARASVRIPFAKYPLDPCSRAAEEDDRRGHAHPRGGEADG
eukprot:679681-Prorocentrum_minimum.AAC.1